MAEENNHAADDDIDQEDMRNLHIDGRHFSSLFRQKWTKYLKNSEKFLLKCYKYIHFSRWWAFRRCRRRIIAALWIEWHEITTTREKLISNLSAISYKLIKLQIKISFKISKKKKIYLFCLMRVIPPSDRQGGASSNVKIELKHSSVEIKCTTIERVIKTLLKKQTICLRICC